MPVCWVRIDDRLVHGQVTVAWRQHLCFQEIWVVDDTLAADPILQDALRLAAPPDVWLRVRTVAEAASAWHEACQRTPVKAKDAGRAQVLVLVKDPQTALALAERGASFSQLNVGNLAARPGSERVFRSISLTREHAAALDRLAEHGIAITFQAVPDEQQVGWSVLRKRIR